MYISTCTCATLYLRHVQVQIGLSARGVSASQKTTPATQRRTTFHYLSTYLYHYNITVHMMSGGCAGRLSLLSPPGSLTTAHSSTNTMNDVQHILYVCVCTRVALDYTHTQGNVRARGPLSPPTCSLPVLRVLFRTGTSPVAPPLCSPRYPAPSSSSSFSLSLPSTVQLHTGQS